MEHEHIPFTEMVDDLQRLLDAARSAPSLSAEMHARFADLASELREELLDHFGSEEECFFPFLVETIPELSGEIAALESEHDQICGSISRIAHLAGRPLEAFAQRMPQVVGIFDRFHVAYVAHSEKETALLRRAHASLDEGHHRALLERAHGIL